MGDTRCTLHSQLITDTREDVKQIRSDVEEIKEALTGGMKGRGVISKVVIMWNCSMWFLITIGGATLAGCIKVLGGF